uniref:TerD family protein n=1 Tax=Streptomyces atriruber TaxID=545121 RepID=UPI000A45E6C8
MTPGSNIPLTAARVAVDVAAPVRLDVSGLLLTADGKVRSDDDFIFFNQPSGPGVTYQSGGGTTPDKVTVDTAAVPPGIEKIVVTASPDAAGQTFQGVEPTATIRNADDGSVLATFTPPRLGTETALVIIEIYRRQGAWKVRAVGQGYAGGLAEMLTDQGLPQARELSSAINDAVAQGLARSVAAPPPRPADGTRVRTASQGQDGHPTSTPEGHPAPAQGLPARQPGDDTPVTPADQPGGGGDRG